MQLCIENVDQAGGCSYGYSCIYTDSISWASPTQPLPMMRDPRVVFDQLFGVGATPQERAERRPEDRSILDWLSTATVAGSRRSSAPATARGSTDYLDDVREIERRIQNVEAHNTQRRSRASCPSAPIGVPDSFAEHVKLMFDLQALAFASDITRVFAFKLGRDASNRVYPESGVKGAFHSASHHGEREDRILDFAEDQHVSRQHGPVSPREAEEHAGRRRQPARQHAGASTARRWATRTCTTTSGCPLFLAGHAGGRLKGGLHLKAADGTPMANAMLSVLHRPRRRRHRPVRRQHERVRSERGGGCADVVARP